jgi:DNA-binding CsgD family transcriptional regulator
LHWLGRLTAESANSRSALDFCLHERGDADTVMDMMLGLPLGSFWARGNLSEVRHWLDEALARPAPVTVLRVRAMLRSSLLAMVGGDAATGRRLLDDARNLIPQTNDPIVLTELHFVDAHAARYAGDLPRAVVELERALALAKSTSADLDWYLDILQSLAFVGSSAAHHERSRACNEEIIALTAPRGESLHRAHALSVLGLDAWRRGDAARAAELQRSGLGINLGFEDVLGTALGLEALAWANGALGQYQRAAQLLGAADTLWDAAGGSVATAVPDLVDEHDRSVAATRAALGDQPYTAAFRRGRQMPLAQVLHDVDGSRRSTRSVRVDAGGAGVLTPREQEVSALLARGLSNKEIANHLVIAQRTAETHVENVMVKLGLTSRSQVAAWTAEHRRGELAE